MLLLSFQEAMVNPFGLAGVEAFGSPNGVEASKTFVPPAQNVINLEDQSSDASCDDDNDDTDLFSEDFMDVDEYAMLQAHFDNVDIPPGIEAPIPFMLDRPKSKKKPVTGSSFVQMPFPIQSGTVGLNGNDSSSSSWLSEPSHFSMNPTSGNSSNLPTQMDSTSQPTIEVELSPPWFPSQSSQSKKKPNALQHRGAAPNVPLGIASRSRWRRPFQYRKKQLNLSSSTNHDSVNQLEVMKLPSRVEPSFWDPHIPHNIKKQVGSESTDAFHSSSFPAYAEMSKLPTEVGSSLPWSQAPFNPNFKSPFFIHTDYSSFCPPLGSAYHPQGIYPRVGNFNHNLKNDAAIGVSTDSVEEAPTPSMDRGEIMRKFQLFKQFDTVDDHSDHHYTRNGSSSTSNGSSLKHVSLDGAFHRLFII